VPTVVRRSAPKSPAFSSKLLRTWGDAMLESLGRAEAELSVLLTNDKTIQRLNLEYRHKDRPTDVLSFHFENDAASAHLDDGWLLGDVVISLDTALRQAKGRKRPLEAEVRWLLAHGVLHLCGYDHATPDDKRSMVAVTRRLVRAAERALAPVAGERRPPKRRRSTTR
jgi:probable rRNA maturation factor